MRVWDRAALGAIGFAGLFFYYQLHTGRTALSAAAALVSLGLLTGAWRSRKNKPKFVYKRKARAACAAARDALRALSLQGEADAVRTVRLVLEDRFSLQEVSPRADGFVCREEGRSVWVSVLARHPEAGCVTASELAQAVRRQHEENAEACTLCALCPSGKPPADSALRAVRVLDADALARLWAASDVPVPAARGTREKRRLFAVFASPLSPERRRRCLGCGALLLVSWVVSRSPLLLLCALGQFARAILPLRKKTPARLCG